MKKLTSIIATGVIATIGAFSATAQDGSMSFFLTSVNPGNGGDLGGLEGADAHCQKLAESAGAGDSTWRAYLSTQGAELGDAAIDARDRIGTGPWFNAKGVKIANDVDELHAADNALNAETVLNENGEQVNGRGAKPNRHDILTGSRPDGTAFPGAFFADMTCGNWTKNDADATAMVGHHDRVGPLESSWATSWNSAHPTLGCTSEVIKKTGGDGLFYCFAE